MKKGEKHNKSQYKNWLKEFDKNPEISDEHEIMKEKQKNLIKNTQTHEKNMEEIQNYLKIVKCLVYLLPLDFYRYNFCLWRLKWRRSRNKKLEIIILVLEELSYILAEEAKI